MDWKIFYADGSTFSSDDGAPNDAPCTGVIVVVQRDLSPPYGREQLQQENYYYWGGSTEQWLGSDRDGLIDRLLEREIVEGVCQGRRVTRAEYHAIVSQAANDPDFQD